MVLLDPSDILRPPTRVRNYYYYYYFDSSSLSGLKKVILRVITDLISAIKVIFDLVSTKFRVISDLVDIT